LDQFQWITLRRPPSRRGLEIDPAEPAVDTPGEQTDTPGRGLHAHLDEALEEGSHVVVEGGREPLDGKGPGPVALGPHPERPLPERRVEVDLGREIGPPRIERTL